MFIKSKYTPELPGESQKGNQSMFTNEQLQQLVSETNRSIGSLNDVISTLPERPSRVKLTSQLVPVLATLTEVQQALEGVQATQPQAATV